MRHGDKIKNHGRKKAHRDALLSNLACQLITHKRIVTTVAKAKALRVYVEPLITKGKTNTTHERRVVFSYLQDKEAITELQELKSTLKKKEDDFLQLKNLVDQLMKKQAEEEKRKKEN